MGLKAKLGVTDWTGARRPRGGRIGTNYDVEEKGGKEKDGEDSKDKGGEDTC